MPSERSQTKGHRDSGAVAVETALVSMLLVTILFGIIEASLLFKDWLTVSAAARAGARMGSSQPRSPAFAQDSANQVTNAISGLNPTKLKEVWVYKTTTAGLLPGSCDSARKCVPFTWNGTQLTTTASGNWTSTSQNACSDDASRDALGVYVKYQHSGLGFFPVLKDAIVSESTVMWLEPSFALVCKP